MPLDMTNSELERAVDYLRDQVRELRDRVDKHALEVCQDRQCVSDLERRFNIAISQIQAIGDSELADED